MIFDFFLIGMVLAGIATGWWKGLVWQLAGVGALVFGVLLGFPLSNLIASFYEDPTVFTRFLIFAFCYAGISLGCYVTALVIRRKLVKVEMQHYDKHMGAFMGAIHGLGVWGLLQRG